jgi:hypothetical protein
MIQVALQHQASTFTISSRVIKPSLGHGRDSSKLHMSCSYYFVGFTYVCVARDGADSMIEAPSLRDVYGFASPGFVFQSRAGQFRH